MPLPPHGLALRGQVWPGGTAESTRPGVVLVDGDGVVLAVLAPDAALPPDVRVLGDDASWVGPGVVDAHVHLAFGAPELALAGGVVALRDLGAPLDRALHWRSAQPTATSPAVAVAGPLLTAPGGYPMTTWGRDGFGLGVADPAGAAAAVRDLAGSVDVVKLALEPGPGWPVPDLATARSLVDAAHAAGLAVTAHALTAAMVDRALDAGVDELCHTPTELLGPARVERIARAGVGVVSTLATFVADDPHSAALANAAALVAAGVPIAYGTDLGNSGTRPGVEPRELALLAAAGLGPWGALRAATCGLGRPGLVAAGEQASLVVLPADPLVEPGAWRRPTAVVTPAGVSPSSG